MVALMFFGLGLASSPSLGQNYPSKPITLVVPSAAGGAWDITARIAAQYINAQSGQTVVVDNRPGAGGNLGTRVVARATPDGYTLGLVTSNLLITNPSFFPDIRFDPLKELVPVGSIGEFPQLLAINDQVPAKTLREFIDLAKAKPGTLSFGSGGLGSTPYLAARTLEFLAGIKLVHVPYRGVAPAVVDLLAGRIQLLGAGLAVFEDHLQSGKLRALAVGSRVRLPQLPDVPTGEEAGVPGYESNSWVGIVVPKNTPKEIVVRLNAYLASMASDQATPKQLEKAYVSPMTTTLPELAALIEREKTAWDKMKASIVDLN